jgi:hypothetical protein
MATLVLSTVGTILGGPIGGAIGSLVGQSIDQQIFASPRRGPRLGDLSVQTSSYGTQIPRIYGAMRVAGSIVWATDLVESSMTSGAKGQPDTTFSYSVSFAVALSSRRAARIGRIWADGKLLRGEAGDFKVNTEFRFHDGSEDQDVDPLIASIEGVSETPAYRGLALAVFEDFELAEFGNRIPFLTFEIFGDEEPTTVGEILADVTLGKVTTSDPSPVIGYAAMGKSAQAAIEPLVDSFGVDIFDDGKKLRSPDPNAPITIEDAALGSVADSRPVARFEVEQTPARELPTSLSLSYYDPERDYQTGLARASATETDFNQSRSELPAVVNAADARTIVENSLARRWARRGKMTVRLAPSYLDLTPGAVMTLGSSATVWQVQRCSVDGMAIVAELRPAWRIAPALAADAGRSNPDVDVVSGPVTLALFEVPNPDEEPLSGPMVYLAASSPSPGWKPVPVEVTLASSSSVIRTARRKSVLGASQTVLARGQEHLLDQINSVDIALIDPSQWLTSCDQDALANGANAALLGDELIQFGDAIPLGDGCFRLTRLLRGRLGTELAMGAHVSGDPFVLIEPDAFQAIRAPATARGAEIRVTERTLAGGLGVTTARIITGNSLRPLSPVGLRAELHPTGDLIASWTRRSRSGWAWLDEVDVPIGETQESYSVRVEGTTGTLLQDCGSPTLTIPAAELSAVGSGPAIIAVRQVGDWAASVPAEISIILP